jgi:hypothetical protein
VAGNPRLLRRTGRRGFHRVVIVSALIGMLLLAPGAGGVPGDPTPPVITVAIFGTLGTDDGKSATNGWYTSNVTVNWTVVDPESIILATSGCEARTLTSDSAGTQLTCTATSDGGTASVNKTITIDKTAPSVATVVERPPDANGWYNHPVTVTVTGTDATSGVRSCSSARYAGPDNAAAVMAGSCTDNAGNVAGASFAFNYDATPPSLFAVTAKRGNRSAELTWRKSTDTQVIEVVRAPGRNGEGETVVFRGNATGYRDTGLVVGRKYEYRVAGIDAAANRTEHKIDFLATGALLSPAAAERVKSPPSLAWIRVKGASYYNVQLVRGRKVLSAWPLRTNFRLRRTWTYKGRRYRLRPGVYRWYVWPGFGRISAARYGRLLGSSTFVVTS